MMGKAEVEEGQRQNEVVERSAGKRFKSCRGRGGQGSVKEKKVEEGEGNTGSASSQE